jgi:hypothetical protein
MDSFVYRWANISLNKIYIGFHKGSEDDGYICSSGSTEFWDDFNDPKYVWKREILFRGAMKECQILESNLIDSVDISSPFVYNNRNNIMFNMNDEVREKLKKSAVRRGQDPEYRRQQSQRTKKQWENPDHRQRISEANSGKKHSAITKDKIRSARAKQVISPESRLKAAEKLKGKSRPQSVKDAISLARANAPNVTCPNCGKIGKYGGSMSRWHFDRCKNI